MEALGVILASFTVPKLGNPGNPGYNRCSVLKPGTGLQVNSRPTTEKPKIPDTRQEGSPSKGKMMIRKLSKPLLTIVALVPVVNIVCQAQSLPLLTRHVREVVLNGQAKPVGQLPLNQTMNLDVVLPLADPAGLASFLQELYDPASLIYRHFLTVPEFTARFGPSQGDYDVVVSFAKANGFAVVGGTRDGMDVQIKGPVSAIQAAFHVTMSTYQDNTAGRTFYAPDREPTINLPFPLWHISGLDNYSNPHPMFVKKSDYAKANGLDPEDDRFPRHHRLRPFVFILGQRHARCLLRRNGAHWRWPEPRTVRVLRHRLDRFDHLFQQRRANQQCADNSALHGRDQHILCGFESRWLL